jgi:hypothetical protein
MISQRPKREHNQCHSFCPHSIQAHRIGLHVINSKPCVTKEDRQVDGDVQDQVDVEDAMMTMEELRIAGVKIFRPG